VGRSRWEPGPVWPLIVGEEFSSYVVSLPSFQVALRGQCSYVGACLPNTLEVSNLSCRAREMRANVVRKWTNLRRYSTQPLKCHRRQVIEEKNPSVNAFVHVSPTPTSSSKDLSLSGLTVAVKDNITTHTLPTTCSSAILRDFVSPFDATVVKLLQNSGADIIGKTNCDEFGMGSLNVHSIHGPVRNPFNLTTENSFDHERSPGGSSGGSAAAVAAGMCDAALGTDTGGSVRLPASYCGVIGLKPSYGLVSRWGVVSYADSLDCVGVLASTIHTTKRVFGTIFEHVNE